MTSLYFVRHAQPDHSSGSDSSFVLTEEGMKDRYYVSELLKDIRLDKACSSPYQRSLLTITPAALEHGFEIITDTRLREREHGAGGNSSPEMFRKRWEDMSFHEPGGESLLDTQKRNISTVSEILESCAEMNVLVGTHGTALSTIINYYDNSFGFNEFMRIIDLMPWIIRLDFDGTEYKGRQELGYIKKEYHGKNKTERKMSDDIQP